MRPKVKNLDVKEGVYIVAGDRATGKQWSPYQDNDMNRNIATEMPVTREKNGANQRLGDAASNPASPDAKLPKKTQTLFISTSTLKYRCTRQY